MRKLNIVIEKSKSDMTEAYKILVPEEMQEEDREQFEKRKQKFKSPNNSWGEGVTVERFCVRTSPTRQTENDYYGIDYYPDNHKLYVFNRGDNFDTTVEIIKTIDNFPNSIKTLEDFIYDTDWVIVNETGHCFDEPQWEINIYLSNGSTVTLRGHADELIDRNKRISIKRICETFDGVEARNIITRIF